ncbi:MAG: hypothetical protein IKY23_09060 [Lachnospiraceae bacterium]|nr:hypothetical protein [Lachnospiraceae bacterium]
METDWMKDESLKDIPSQKLDFLQTLLFESSSLKKEQMMPFLLNIAKLSREQSISFSDAEIEAITAVLRRHATADEIKKMEKILALKKKKS